MKNKLLHKLFKSALLGCTFVGIIVSYSSCRKIRTTTVENLVAGNLKERISTEEITSTEKLVISGQLNGTDISLIREMTREGKLSQVDISETSIVSGGKPYYIGKGYASYRDTTKHYTHDNEIGEYMFSCCYNMKSIKLPKTIRKIQRYAFEICHITQITIPDSCEEVCQYAFTKCPELEHVKISAKVHYWGPTNCEECPSILSFEVDNNNQYYSSENGVLYSKDGSKIVKYPIGKKEKNFKLKTSLNTIGYSAFRDAQIKKIEIPETVTVIEDGAFTGCKELTDINIPSQISKIHDFTFAGCEKLESIMLPQGLEEIGDLAFGDCKSLKTIHIGEKIKKISSIAFSRGLLSLREYSVSPQNTFFTASDKMLMTKDKKTILAVPSLTDSIFYIQDGIENINGWAFSNTQNIKEIVFPKTLKEINSMAFSENKSLKVIQCPIEDATQLKIKGKLQLNKDCTWYIPSGKKSLYEQCDWWNKSWHIIEF
ncbi:MAG: leucine-rich repeat domain-containing protein [Prevotella sp.]|nr:leucine-rich repeat domain-containing protein [Prevotella sp.]